VSLPDGLARKAHLGQHVFVLLDLLIRQLDSGALDVLLLLALLLLGSNLSWGPSGILRFCRCQTTSFHVTLQTSLENGLDQVVSTEDFVGLDVLAHPVGEPRVILVSLHSLPDNISFLTHLSTWPEVLSTSESVMMVVSSSSMSSSMMKCFRHASRMFA
jgi:hypothetical protein